MSTQNKNTQVAKLDKGQIVYQVAGQDVKLSYQIVRDYLTKGNSEVSDQDLTQFISICKYNQLNPFLNEAYLVKFGNSPAQMIVSKEAFFKRADANENYQGIRSGIIVQRDNEVLELEGCFKLKSDVLLGGWAEVHRSDKKFPIISKVSLDEYDKKQSIWNEKKSTMISKISKVQALREAFPAQLGAMYTQEEAAETIDISHEDVSNEVKRNANKKQISFDDAPEEKGQPKPETNINQEAENQRLFDEALREESNNGPGF